MSVNVQNSARISDIVRRMTEYGPQAEPMKTCLGILAIMSREEANKLLISREAMETIMNVMTIHVEKSEIQEAGCDLLWSLAFGNATVKEIIAKYGGASVMVRALKRHGKSADFLKSACGALSNICQCKLNQEGVASLGGLQPLVGSIHAHQNNGKLLPFIFDALASLVVGNEDNARTVSSLGFIPLVISSIARHKVALDIVKSGCHALAILTDVKGQASKIAFAGGVATILPVLDLHPAFSDLHRVSTVVLLRMLQESCHVAREIVSNEGIRILLKSLELGGSLNDTVAAVAHILFTVTTPSNSSSTIESQLWKQLTPEAPPSMTDVGSPKTKSKGQSKLSSVTLDSFSIANSIQSDSTQVCTLNVIVKLLEDYQERKDVVRAACRLLNNICEYAGVVVALDKCFVLDKMLECAAKFAETKDIVESTISVFKALYKRTNPTVHIEHSILRLTALLDIYRNRLGDEMLSTACIEMLTKFITLRSNKDGGLNFVPTIDAFEQKKTADKDDITEYRSRDGKTMEFDILNVTLRAMDRLVNGEKIPDIAASDKDSVSSDQMITKLGPSRKRTTWNKVTLKQLSCMLGLFEALISLRSVQENIPENQILYEALLATSSSVSLKATDIGKRLQKLIYLVRPYTVAKSDSEAIVEKCESFDTTGEESSTTSMITEDLGDSSAAGSNEKYVSPKGSPPLRKTSFWKLEGPDGEALSPSSDALSAHGVTARRLLPHHPCKVRGTQLLETWPNYLERLLPPASTALSKTLELAGGTIPDRMRIVYEGASAAGQGLLSRVTAPLPYVFPPEGVGERFEHSLTFDSEFESGNLQCAVQRGDAEYDLFLRSDLHTAGHTQWFYFAVSNTHPMPLVRLAEQGVQVPAVRVRFNIVNLTKPDSLFNMGMRPVLYSCANAALKGTGWVRAGSDISYYSNTFQRNNNAGEGMICYYTLSFAIEFQNPRDTYLIAYSYPYTMHDYRCHLGTIMSKRNSSDVIRSSILCTTLGGQDCPLLVITDFKESKDVVGPITVNDTFREVEKRNTAAARAAMSARGGPAPVTMKPALFFSGRVHPGEPPASWMMKGMIDYLSSSHPVAVKLRQLFVIYIVPVLNPDGVLYGNNRCSLAGVDLNRQWKAPTKNLYPTVFALKTFMQAQKRLREICMYIDLHGHSRKYNVFMYGCDTDKKKPRPQVRAFPRFFSVNELAQKYVSFNDCSFHIKKGREGTARVIVCKELNIPLSFTLEATFCGPNYGPLKSCHMNMGHLQEVGVSLCDTIYRFAMSPEGRSSFYTMSSNTPILASPMDSSVPSTVIVSAESSSDIPGDSEMIDGGSGSDSEDEQVQPSSVSKSSGKGREGEVDSKFSSGQIQNAMPAIEHSSKSSAQLGAGSRPVHRSSSQFAYSRQDNGTSNLEFLKPQAVDDLAVVRASISDTLRRSAPSPAASMFSARSTRQVSINPIADHGSTSLAQSRVMSILNRPVTSLAFTRDSGGASASASARELGPILGSSSLTNSRALHSFTAGAQAPQLGNVMKIVDLPKVSR